MVAVIALEVIQLVAAPELRGFLPLRYEGMAANPNAFAFQMIMAFAAAMALCLERTSWNNSRIVTVLGGVVVAGLWFSASRAAWIAFAGLLVFLLVFRIIDWRRLASMVMVGLAIVSAMIGYEVLVGHLLGGGSGGMSFDFIVSQRDFLAQEDNDNLRMESLLGGMKLWLAQPIFGAGLGAYIHQTISEAGGALVIHNTPLWILAELGIVGAIVFGAGAIRLFAGAVALLRRRPDPGALLICLIFLGMGGMFLFHELMFQRSFWFLLGVGMAHPMIREIHARNAALRSAGRMRN